LPAALTLPPLALPPGPLVESPPGPLTAPPPWPPVLPVLLTPVELDEQPPLPLAPNAVVEVQPELLAVTFPAMASSKTTARAVKSTTMPVAPDNRRARATDAFDGSLLMLSSGARHCWRGGPKTT
jgi:hypothetical protein